MSTKVRRMGRMLRHPIKTVGWTGIGWWAWRNRHQLASFGAMAKTAPRRVLRGEYRDLLTEARLRARLAADPTGRQVRRARLVGVENGEAIVDGDPTSPDYAALVRLVTDHRGIRTVRQRVAGGPAGRPALQAEPIAG